MSSEGPRLLVIERILRDRQSIWQQIIEERELGGLTGQMLASSAIALAGYGAVLGSFHGVLMALTSAVKLPLLFLITLAICLPTLYLFNLVFGARLSVRQALAMVLVAITVTAMLAVAFAPISLFFLITAPDYGFFKLLNVAILTLSAVVGLRFLTSGMQVLNENGLLSPAPTAPQTAPIGQAVPIGQAAPEAAPAVAAQGAEPVEPALVAAGDSALVATAVSNGNGGAGGTVPGSGAGVPAAVAPQPPVAAPPVPGVPAGQPQPFGSPSGYPSTLHVRPPAAPAGQRPASMTLLYIWIMLFGFVGTQLAWTLRPFFGSPGEKFALFRSIEGNFYAEILRTIGNLF